MLQILGHLPPQAVLTKASWVIFWQAPRWWWTVALRRPLQAGGSSSDSISKTELHWTGIWWQSLVSSRTSSNSSSSWSPKVMVHWNLQVSLVSSNFSSSSNPASKLKPQDDGPLELMGDGSPWSPLYRRLPPARLPSEGSHQVWRKRSTTIRNTPGTRISPTIFTIWIHRMIQMIDTQYPSHSPP